MPILTGWFIKSALAYFVAAFLLGVVLGMPAVFAVPLLWRSWHLYISTCSW